MFVVRTVKYSVFQRAGLYTYIAFFCAQVCRGWPPFLAGVCCSQCCPVVCPFPAWCLLADACSFWSVSCVLPAASGSVGQHCLPSLWGTKLRCSCSTAAQSVVAAPLLHICPLCSLLRLTSHLPLPADPGFHHCWHRLWRVRLPCGWLRQLPILPPVIQVGMQAASHKLHSVHLPFMRTCATAQVTLLFTVQAQVPCLLWPGTGSTLQSLYFRLRCWHCCRHGTGGWPFAMIKSHNAPAAGTESVFLASVIACT